MKKTIIEATQKLKTKVDISKKDVQFEVEDYFMVYLNKSRLLKGIPTKLQIKRVGPCKVVAKYGQNAYKVKLLIDLSILPVFNVTDFLN